MRESRERLNCTPRVGDFLRVSTVYVERDERGGDRGRETGRGRGEGEGKERDGIGGEGREREGKEDRETEVISLVC